MTKFENSWGIHTEPNHLPYGHPNYSQMYSLYTYLPMNMEQSVPKRRQIQTPGNYPEENIQHVRILACHENFGIWLLKEIISGNSSSM